MFVILTGEFIFTAQKGAPYTPANAVVVGGGFQINDAFPCSRHGYVRIKTTDFNYLLPVRQAEWEYLLLWCERFAMIGVG